MAESFKVDHNFLQEKGIVKNGKEDSLLSLTHEQTKF